MKKSDQHDERVKRLAIEEVIRREAIKKVARDRMKQQGIRQPPILPFAIAAGLLTALVTSIFFAPYHLVVLLNTFLAAFVVNTVFGACLRFIVSPGIISITLGWIFSHQKSQPEIERWIKSVYLVAEVLLVAGLILLGIWVGSQTRAHEGLFIWNWLLDVLR